MHLRKYPYFSLVIISALLFQITSCNANPRQSLTALKDKPKAPNFKLIDMDDKSHTLNDFKGNPIIINFWATWCPPCREELPSMNRAWKKIKKEGIKMIAINVGEDEDTIFAFSAEYPIDFMVLLDEKGDEINKWPIKGLPTTFVIDPQGRIIYQAVGGREWDDDGLLNKVRALK